MRLFSTKRGSWAFIALLSWPLYSASAASPLADVIGTTPESTDDLAIIATQATNVHRETPKAIVWRGPKGLEYGADSEGQRLPDFSYAGYMGGGVAIPDVPVRVALTADAKDPDRDRSVEIQEALDRLAAMPIADDGFRGALLLGKGKFVVSETLKIAASGMVVRGRGAGFGGTWIYHKARAARQTEMQYLGGISVEGGMVPTFMLTAKGGLERRVLTDVPADASIPCGERVIPVVDAGALAPGMEIILEVAYTAKWLEGLHRPENWGTRTIVPRLRRRIVAVDAAQRRITLERPLSLSIDRKNGLVERSRISAVLADSRPNRIGIEDLLCLSGYDPGKVDKGGYYNDENHPFSIFHCEGAVDVWMRRVVGFFYSMSLMTPNASARVTVEDCAMLDGVSRDTPATHTGARKYYFNISADDMLVQRCYGRHGRHAFVGNGTWEGGVFRDCYSERDHLNIEWHQQWGYGHLYDQVFCHAPIAMRGCTNAMHGQCAAFSLAWNCAIRNDLGAWADLWANRVPGILVNWASGNLLLGSGRTARGEDSGGGHHMGELGLISYSGSYMPIRSLSLAQLEERLGKDAVKGTATAVQRDGKHGATWANLVSNFSRLPVWMNPGEAPWPGLETWLATFPRVEPGRTVPAPDFARGEVKKIAERVAELETDARYLGDFPEESLSVHRDTLHRNKRYSDDKPASIAGTVYPKSLLLHPKSDTRRGEVVFPLDAFPGARSFLALVGIEDNTGGKGSVTFEVALWDGAEWATVFQTPVLGGGDLPTAVNVPLGNAKKIRLSCTDGGDGVGADHAVWALARVR